MVIRFKQIMVEVVNTSTGTETLLHSHLHLTLLARRLIQRPLLCSSLFANV